MITPKLSPELQAALERIRANPAAMSAVSVVLRSVETDFRNRYEKSKEALVFSVEHTTRHEAIANYGAIRALQQVREFIGDTK